MTSPDLLDRFSGADASFEALADAVHSSFWNDPSPDLRADQVRALRALLHVSWTHYVGNMLALAVVRSKVMAEELSDQVLDAVEYATREIEAGHVQEFDRALQTAALVAPLMLVDDGMAASYADRLLDSNSLTARSLRELPESLGVGRGPATLAVLERMKVDENSPAADEVAAALSRERARLSKSHGCVEV